jgi:hypothetical protein
MAYYIIFTYDISNNNKLDLVDKRIDSNLFRLRLLSLFQTESRLLKKYLFLYDIYVLKVHLHSLVNLALVLAAQQII